MADDKNILDDLDRELSAGYDGEDGFSLESILAEYKGSAFMDGDKRTPSDELQRRTDEILREVRGGAPAGRTPEPEPGPAPEPEPAPEPGPEPEPVYEDEPRPRRGLFGRRRAHEDPEPEAGEPEEAEPEYPEPREEPRRRPRRHAFPSRNMEAPPEPAYEDAPEIDLSVFDEPEEPEPVREKKAPKTDDFYDSLIRDEPLAPPEEPEKPEKEDDSDMKIAGRGFDGYAGDVRDTWDDGEEEEAGDSRRRGLFGRLFGRRDESAEDAEDGGYDEDDYDSGDSGEQDDRHRNDGVIDLGPEPDMREEAQRFASRVPSLRFRILGATVTAAIAVVFTFLFARGSAPFGVERAATATGVLMILELVVMCLGLDVLIRGFEDILALSPGAETLVLVSCAVSVLDGFEMLLTGSFDRGLPLAAVSAVSLLGAMCARKSIYMAYTDSLRTAVATGSSSGVTEDMTSMEDRRILKKVAAVRTGFYAKLAAPDAGESLYDDLAPLLVITSFVLAFISTVAHGAPGAFTHSFSIMTAVSAAFPVASLFALPFKYAASALRKAGSAIGGYAGAADIYDSDGALITDNDIFPVGSVSLSGVKIFEGADPRRVLADTASLVIASDSGLARVFDELLRDQNLSRTRIDDFACYDGGGIGGVIDGQRVLVGTGAFMSLMGLRVPDGINTTSSVFSAINDELAGVFSLEYIPSNSVQTALVALLNTNTNILMAVRDFNVTPNTVKQKFKVSMDGVEYLPIETAYSLSQNVLEQGSLVSAILARGGLAPFAEVITRGRLLKLITGLNTCVTAVGTALAMVIMFFLCWTGAFASASAVNIFLFMSVIGLAVYIMSQATRKKMK